jgi:hypothetical protein
MTIGRTTPQHARQWLITTIEAITPTKRPTEKWRFEGRQNETRAPAQHRPRTFALPELSHIRSQWCFGGSALAMRMYISYPYGVSYGTTVEDMTGVISSDFDDIRQALEYRASWDTGIAGVAVGDTQILGADEGGSAVVAFVDITIDYKPLGV